MLTQLKYTSRDTFRSKKCFQKKKFFHDFPSQDVFTSKPRNYPVRYLFSPLVTWEGCKFPLDRRISESLFYGNK